MTHDDLLFDRQHIWHPYTSLTDPLPCYPVVSASGCELTLADGRTLIDGMSSWWAAIHGYGHPYIISAMQKQLETLPHVMFGGITHPPAVALCRQLISLTSDALDCVFLSDSGSVAVEVAMKMALQYWLGKGERRQQFLTLRGGYHGDTFAAMSVCDPQNAMHSLWRGYLPEHLFAPLPASRFHDEWDEQGIIPFRNILSDHHQEIAAVILEPIVQGAGGMRFFHPQLLKEIRALCDERGILLIADEIATGFGRTGKLFACEHASITPDIMCLGKALTGGNMTLAATLAQRHVAETIGQGEAACFMHGPTFMANPLACAAACASLSLMETGEWQQQVSQIAIRLQQGLMPLRDHPRVADVRVLGAIGVVELHQPVNMAALQHFFVKQGVWIRPFGRLIYLMPPFIIRGEELGRLMLALSAALDLPTLLAEP